MNDILVVRKASHLTRKKFNKMTDEELLEIMHDPRLDGGLYHIISDMTLSYEDIEKLVEVDKYLGVRNDENH